jgi:class 3 adenylate cyclase
MEAAGFGSGNRICTVVFVDIARYSEAPVSRQVEMKARFGALLNTALEQTPAADRLVLDTGDGAALCFLGDPEDGLFAANHLRAGVLEEPEADGLRLRIGINLGPVRFVKDVNNQRNVIGDGINVAQRVMSFAEPNQILVSRSYYEVVSRLSPEYGQLFHYAGLHKDKHVREHEVYEVQLSASARGEPAAASPAPEVLEAPAGPRFEPVLLARVTSALAREIGPVAKIIVRKAADRALDARSLCEALALNVPEPGRAAFLAGLADVSGPPAASAAPTPAPAAPEPAPDMKAPARRDEVTAEVLARAEQMLGRQIGPLARLLVREAAKQAKSPRDLFERLAVHIDNEQSRKLFLAEGDR